MKSSRRTSLSRLQKRGKCPPVGAGMRGQVTCHKRVYLIWTLMEWLDKTGMTVYVYIDNSNIWIEGKKIAAGLHGRDMGERYRIDFGRLLREVSGGRVIYSARLYGSRPPPADSVWKAAETLGIRPTILDRNKQNKEKGVDAELLLDAGETLSETPVHETMVLVAGDGDYVPLCERIGRRGWKAEVHFWDNAAVKLQKSAEFNDLTPKHEAIGRYARSADEDLLIETYSR